ncbi:MAG: oligosaccharide flippase family protein [Bacteroidetes bacterium]|nr:oligosaccharide flippase family protein [Bacteroidota bacterium]
MKKIYNILNDVYSKGFFHLFSANSLIHLIEFGSQLFVAWILLADDIGRIKSLQTFAAVGVIIAGLGFNTSILKLCSEKNVTNDEKQTLFASAIKTTLLFSFLTVLLGIILSYFNLISNDTLTNNLFIYYCLSIPLLALNNLLIAYYQALKEFKKVSVLLIVARIIHVAIIISLTYLFGVTGFIVGIILLLGF